MDGLTADYSMCWLLNSSLFIKVSFVVRMFVLHDTTLYIRTYKNVVCVKILKRNNNHNISQQCKVFRYLHSQQSQQLFSVVNNGNTLVSGDLLVLVLVLCRTCDVSLLSTPDDDYCHANKGLVWGGGQLRVVCLTITRQRKGLTQSAKGWKNTYGLLKTGS